VISYSPGLAYASNVRPGILSSSSPALIVVASAAQGAFLPPLPDAQAEGSDVASCFREASLLSGSRAIALMCFKSFETQECFILSATPRPMGTRLA